MKFFLILIVLNSVCSDLLAQALTTGKSQLTPHQVSIEQILVRPQQYDGQLVQIRGYLNLAYEAHAIYSQKDDVAKQQLKNGLWVNFSTAINKQQLAACNQTYVVVVGTFDARSKGHLGLFGGTLKNISSLTTK